MCRAVEQGDEADEAFAGAGQTVAPAHARAVPFLRGHRFAAYRQCSTDHGERGTARPADGVRQMRVPLGAVVAERRLRIEGQPTVDVTLRVGLPMPFPPEPPGTFAGYYCPYQIVGIGREKVGYAPGVDAVQALEEAIHILPTELDALRRDHPGLRWEDAPAGDFGFTRAVSAFQGRRPGESPTE
jgi:hypothetical protein